MEKPAHSPTWESRPFAQVDIDWLVYFRLVFGGVMFYWVAKCFLRGWVDSLYIAPRFHFHYLGLEWIHPWPGEWMRVHFLVLGIAATLITLGLFYRIASIVVAMGFTHVFLIDKCLYQNHYYLVCLLAGIMAVMPAQRAFALDAWFRPAIRSRLTPAWTLWLVRFQVGVPYFFGGVAKLNSDWIAGEPMRTMLAQRTWYPGIGPYFTEEWCVQFFVWGGLLFDLLVVPALLWRPTRAFAYGVALAFHLMNATLFTIGIFPWFMILATVVFFPPGSLRRLFDQATQHPSTDLSDLAVTTRAAAFRKLTLSLIAVYVVVQIGVPLRHYLLPGNPSWTEEGHYFAWHMLLRGKVPAVRFNATDPTTGRSGAIDLRRYVTPHQMGRFARDPRMIHELSQMIAMDLRDMGFRNIEIRVLALVSMNGRKPQVMIDPTVNLAAEPRQWRPPRWIVPLKEPLPSKPWDVPLEQWEKYVDLASDTPLVDGRL